MTHLEQTSIWPALQATLAQAEQQGQRLDSALDARQAAGEARFAAIMAIDGGFACRANRFSPYLTELREAFEALRTNPDWQTDLPGQIRRLQDLLAVMARTEQTDLYTN